MENIIIITKVINMKYYSIGKFSELIGKTPQTLRDWHKKGSFIPNHITDGGTRYYSQEQLNHFLGIKVDNVKTYMIAKGYSFEVITDIGSGIN